MDKNILNEYLNQLKEFEEKINGEDNLDDNFINEINNLLVKISRVSHITYTLTLEEYTNMCQSDPVCK